MFRNLLIVAISCLTFSFLSSCEIVSDEGKVRVDFNNPNPEALYPETDSIEVSLVDNSGKEKVIYQGKFSEGPWASEMEKKSITLKIKQFDSEGNLLDESSYHYNYSSNQLTIAPKIEIFPAQFSLDVSGEPQQLLLKVFPTANNQIAIWSSENPDIAEVGNEGLVKPISKGQVMVFAKLNDDLRDTAYVTVTDTDNILRIEITEDPKNLSVLNGEVASFEVEADGKSVSYAWYLDSVLQEDEDKSIYSLSSNIDMDSAVVYAMAYNPWDTVYSTSALLRVTEETTIPTAIPKIVTQPKSDTVFAGEKASFSVEAVGDDLQYQWYNTDVLIEGAATASYQTPILSLEESGSLFEVVVFNDGGEVTSNQAEIIVLLPPPINPTNFKGSLLGNDSLALSWDDNNSYEDNYQIYRYTQGQDNQFLLATLAENTSTYSDVNFSIDSSYVYRLKAVNNSGESWALDSVIISPVPKPQITTPPTDVSTEVGKKAAFEVEASGQNLSYSWYRDGIVIQNATTSTYQTEVLSLDDDGSFFEVIVKNEGGEVKSQRANLTVQLPLPITITNFSANTVDDESIYISWDDNNLYESSYKIYRRLAGSANFSEITSLPENSTSFTDVGLDPNTQYEYNITVLNSAGEAGPENIASANTFGPPIPGNFSHVIEGNEIVASGSIQSNGGANISRSSLCYVNEFDKNIICNPVSLDPDLRERITVSRPGFKISIYFVAENKFGVDSSLVLEVDFPWTCGFDFTDKRDGQMYGTVNIGTQCWFQENLNYMPESYDSWCNGDSLSGQTSNPNCDIYGRMYSNDGLYANGIETNICPEGWIAPDYVDWNTLSQYVISNYGSSTADYFLVENTPGAKWTYSNPDCNIDPVNQTGFSAIPGGFYDYNGYTAPGRMITFGGTVDQNLSSMSTFTVSGEYCNDIQTGLSKFSTNRFYIRCLLE